MIESEQSLGIDTNSNAIGSDRFTFFGRFLWIVKCDFKPVLEWVFEWVKRSVSTKSSVNCKCNRSDFVSNGEDCQFLGILTVLNFCNVMTKVRVVQ